MKDKIKAVLDSKTTWMVLGTITGSIFGDQAASAISSIGIWVMAVL